MSDWDFLWGLKGQELVDAMSSGGTYEDWKYIGKIERQQCQPKDKSISKKNTRVFIDAENISSAHAPGIETEIRDIGNVAEVRYYAMQKDPATASWKSTTKKYGYKPIIMGGMREKNKIDNKIIQDAKKVMKENRNIDIFVIVSRDGDYKELVEFLRSNRKRVVVLGTKNTSRKLEEACNEFRSI